MDRDPAHAVVGPDGDDGVVGQAPVGEDAVAVLGQEVGPVLGLRALGVGDGQAVAGGVEVGVEVEAAVGADVGVGGGVEPFLDGDQPAVAVGGGEVGDPDVVAGGGAEVLGEQQPAAVVRDVDGVVGGGVAPVAEDQLVGLGVGAGGGGSGPGGGRPPRRPARRRREPPDVVEPGTVGGPGQRAVAAAVDGPVDRLAGCRRP